MQMKTRKQLLKSPIILDFLDACLNYIRIMENEEIKGESFLNKIHHALCDVYTKALPFMELEFDGPDEIIRLDRRLIWPEGKPNVLVKLGDEKCYKEIFNPFSINSYDPMIMTLEDDLRNIY